MPLGSDRHLAADWNWVSEMVTALTLSITDLVCLATADLSHGAGLWVPQTPLFSEMAAPVKEGQKTGRGNEEWKHK